MRYFVDRGRAMRTDLGSEIPDYNITIIASHGDEGSSPVEGTLCKGKRELTGPHHVWLSREKGGHLFPLVP